MTLYCLYFAEKVGNGIRISFCMRSDKHMLANNDVNNHGTATLIVYIEMLELTFYFNAVSLAIYLIADRQSNCINYDNGICCIACGLAVIFQLTIDHKMTDAVVCCNICNETFKHIIILILILQFKCWIFSSKTNSCLHINQIIIYWYHIMDAYIEILLGILFPK